MLRHTYILYKNITIIHGKGKVSNFVNLLCTSVRIQSVVHSPGTNKEGKQLLPCRGKTSGWFYWAARACCSGVWFFYFYFLPERRYLHAFEHTACARFPNSKYNKDKLAARSTKLLCFVYSAYSTICTAWSCDASTLVTARKENEVDCVPTCSLFR